MIRKSCLLIGLTLIALHQVINGQPTLTPEQITCIRSEFMKSYPTHACNAVQGAIEMLYGVDDVIDAIGTRLDLFDTFCMPSCGQAIINAWGTCNVYYDDVKSVGELLINLCSSNYGRPCYKYYKELVEGFNPSTCQASLQSGWCSTECRNYMISNVQSYGCCINVPIQFLDATDPADVNAGANTLFTNCYITRPPSCPATALGPPGNGHQEQTTAAPFQYFYSLTEAPIQYLNSLIASLMQL